MDVKEDLTRVSIPFVASGLRREWTQQGFNSSKAALQGAAGLAAGLGGV